jgi:hypothetical protein
VYHELLHTSRTASQADVAAIPFGDFEEIVFALRAIRDDLQYLRGDEPFAESPHPPELPDVCGECDDGFLIDAATSMIDDHVYKADVPCADCLAGWRYRRADERVAEADNVSEIWTSWRRVMAS